MKLLRIKITDLRGFRSLQPEFEHRFRNEWALQEELARPDEFAPFVCAGPNGSGKSNLLEALAAIFFQLEVQRVRRNFLPESFQYDKIDNPDGIKESDGTPNAFELEYLIKLPVGTLPENERFAHVLITKEESTSPTMRWLNPEKFAAFSAKLGSDGVCTEYERDFLLPEYVVGYSSGENEILSLPFFKMRFVQFDEYWNSLKEQLPYPGRPETRLAYLDNGFSQAIFLCNLLMQEKETLLPFSQDIGIEALKEFRIIIRRSIEINTEQLSEFANKDENQRETLEETIKRHPAIFAVDSLDGSARQRVNLLQLLEGDDQSDNIISRLKRCATCWFVDETNDTLILDYWVNKETRQAFQENFDYSFYKSPLGLFQAFQVLLTLNLHVVSNSLKDDLYKSDSHYVSETVPMLASDQRIMRFKFVKFSKQGVVKPMMLKELSDGEHQLLHSLGLCLLFKNTRSLFLLDEPETHFNPDWRSNFISRLRQCLATNHDTASGQEMLITTHTPFLISDSKPEKVLVFSKENGVVSIKSPEYNTLGASINKITMNTFDKRETIGGYAQTKLEAMRLRFESGEDKGQVIADINRELGDSVEKILLIKTILDSMEVKT